jgi:hypothetical protein
MKKMKTALLLSALAISGTAMADLNTGLVAYYCFDDVTNLGKDCSVNGNNGTAEGQVTASTGLVGGSATFGGYNNPADIHIPNSPSLQFANDVTISFAVNMTGVDGMDGNGGYAAFNGAHTILAKSGDSSGFSLLVLGDDKKNLFAEPASFSWGGNNSSAVVKNYNVGQWQHFTYVFSVNTHSVKIFANGVLALTKTLPNLSFSAANKKDLYLGKYGFSWYPLNGSLDEVRLYNRALSTTEISNLYALTKPVGGLLQGFNLYAATCTNTTTAKSVTVANITNPLLDCEKAGLVVSPKNNVTITIKGNAH